MLVVFDHKSQCKIELEIRFQQIENYFKYLKLDEEQSKIDIDRLIKISNDKIKKA